MATLSNDKTYCIVEKGDTLTKIAKAYSSITGGKTANDLAKLNNISNPNLIHVGQNIKLTGSTTSVKTNTSSRPEITAFGLQANTERTVFATWSWDKSNTDKYETMWYYDTGNNKWFVGSDSDAKYKESIYNAPSNALKVKFKVKAVSTTHKVNGKDTAYWTGSWSTEKVYDLSDAPPKTPPVPEISLNTKNNLLECECKNIPNDINASVVHFAVHKDHKLEPFKMSNTTIQEGRNYARYTCYIDPGAVYTVRARTSRDGQYSEWSNYSQEVTSKPLPPSGITTCRPKSESSVYLAWDECIGADSYEIEYATKEEYLGSSNMSQSQSGIEYPYYLLGNLEGGHEYFFRVRAHGGNPSSPTDWTKVVSVKIGSVPEAPTTWSSSDVYIKDEENQNLALYWVHNNEDGSHMTAAQINFYEKDIYSDDDMADAEQPEETWETLGITDSISFIPVPDDEQEPIYSDSEHLLDFISKHILTYTNRNKVYWKIRTAGITGEFGKWSVRRVITVYEKPTLNLNVTNSNGSAFTQLTSFPIKVNALAGPKEQTPISYHLTIVANTSYETTDHIGNVKMVSAGDEVYSKHFEITDALNVTLSAGDVDLENNVGYTLKCIVAMDSGLTAEAEQSFTVSWTDVLYEPNAEITIDRDTLVAYIRPYCENERGAIVNNILLSVYRREYDGGFTEIIRDVGNHANTFIVDPHPSLDFARYRIVAVTQDTGAVSFCDLAGYPVGEPAVIIQWDDDWVSFDAAEGGVMETPPWTGSMIRLPYNIDVTENRTVDVSLIEYIGREYPVSYYGTQRGESASWKMDIEKSDKETVYALRRLASWAGDAYVREPSGVGYWANVKVSFSQNHCDLVIPVTLTITRVEGGV